MKPESPITFIDFETPYTKTPHILEIPLECKKCGLPNFKIWGTTIRGRLKIEVRCIRCGTIQSIINTSLEQGDK